MSSFVVNFTGSYDILKNELNKVTEVTIEKLSDFCAIVKCNCVDELNYLKGNEYENDTKIIDIQLYIDTPIEESISSNFGIAKPLQVVREVVGELSDSIKSLDLGLQDALLNSKSPLPTEDPFNYVINKQFLLFSAFSGCLILFVATLF